MAVLEGALPEPQPEADDVPLDGISIANACDAYLSQVRARGLSQATQDAYRHDLKWFRKHLPSKTVGQVSRRDLLNLLGRGIELGLSAQTRRRAVQVGLAALREAGATIYMKRGDWPRKEETKVEVYEPEEIRRFFEACTDDERLLFQTYLLSGFRNREIAHCVGRTFTTTSTR